MARYLVARLASAAYAADYGRVVGADPRPPDFGAISVLDRPIPPHQTVAAAAGVTDSTPGNNSATDIDTLTPQANLGITKTDGVTTAVPGGTVTYTITASNAGPSNAPGSTVADAFPASLARRDALNMRIACVNWFFLSPPFLVCYRDTDCSPSPWQ